MTAPPAWRKAPDRFSPLLPAPPKLRLAGSEPACAAEYLCALTNARPARKTRATCCHSQIAQFVHAVPIHRAPPELPVPTEPFPAAPVQIIPGGGSIGGRSRPCAFFCTSISENSIAGADAETGTHPDSAPQIPLNTSTLFPGNYNPLQRRDRRAHNVHSPHQLVRPPIRIHAPHNYREHLESLRRLPLRKRESAFHILEIQSVRLALLLDFFNELLPQIRLGNQSSWKSLPNFPGVPVAISPGCRRPCPFDWLKLVMGIRDIRKFFSMPSLITSTRCAGTPSSSNSYVPANFTPSSSFSVGSSTTLKKLGRIDSPTFFVNVCPSSSPRWRWPSSR